MKSLPTDRELKKSFTDFWRFTFELLEKIELKPHYLKFAAVNSQIALELFLKYLYVKKGRSHEIQKNKKGQLVADLVDFSQIVGHFYSSRTWSYGKKNELVKLMETRNSIVHRGQQTEWNRELAESIVRTLFFIHGTAWSELDEPLLFDNYKPHKISENEVWREGVQSFIKYLASHFEFEALTCLACDSKSVVNGELMVLDENHSEEHLICLNCLTAIDTSHEARLIECYMCYEMAYLIDAFNEQNDQLYAAKCSECGTDTWVRQCKDCENFYHPSSGNEVRVNGIYFCSRICSEYFAESGA